MGLSYNDKHTNKQQNKNTLSRVNIFRIIGLLWMDSRCFFPHTGPVVQMLGGFFFVSMNTL